MLASSTGDCLSSSDETFMWDWKEHCPVSAAVLTGHIDRDKAGYVRVQKNFHITIGENKAYSKNISLLAPQESETRQVGHKQLCDMVMATFMGRANFLASFFFSFAESTPTVI